jgi:hypothetical protein
VVFRRGLFYPRNKGARYQLRSQNLGKGIELWMRLQLVQDGIEPNPGPGNDTDPMEVDPPAGALRWTLHWMCK